jgi:hypothetical protein
LTVAAEEVAEAHEHLVVRDAAVALEDDALGDSEVASVDDGLESVVPAHPHLGRVPDALHLQLERDAAVHVVADGRVTSSTHARY